MRRDSTWNRVFYDVVRDFVENLIYIIKVHNHSIQSTNNINCIPRTNVLGGYYGLVIITPRPRPQTLNRLRDNLTNPYRIAYVDWYRWEDNWEARWARSDYLWATQDPPNSQQFTFCYIVTIYEKPVVIFFPCYTYICSVMRSYCPDIFFHLGLA